MLAINVQNPQVVKAGEYYQEQTVPLYQRYLEQKPDITAFGKDMILAMLRDATYSLLAYTIKANNLYKVNINSLVDYTIKYANIYYAAVGHNTKSGVLSFLQSIYLDFFLEHQPNNNADVNRKTTSENVYSVVKQLIQVAEPEHQNLLR